MEINGYKLTSTLTCDKSGFSKWGFAQKDGREYFIKQFLSPVFPLNRELLSEEQIKSKTLTCKKFAEEKSEIYKAIAQCSNGNIVPILNFFRFKSHYYIVTEKINARPLTAEEFLTMSDSQKMIITKIIVYSVGLLHDKGILHGDIKPDNFMFSKSSGGIYTAKLIDFDGSFFAHRPPVRRDRMQGDTVYYSPETYLYIAGESDEMTTRADVFSVGALLHLIWTGELPWFDKNEYDYLFEAVLSDAKIGILRTIPPGLALIINQMLNKNPMKRPSLTSVFLALDKIKVD